MEGHHFVHAVTRIVGREFLLQEQEREYIWNLIKAQSLFSGTTVVTAVVLSNHMHLLLEQLDRESLPKLTAEELFQNRLPHIYNQAAIKKFQKEYDRLLEQQDQGRIDAWLQRFENRMYSVSHFMGEVKQKFSQWYNRRNNRKGTLWEERFKSVLVENNQGALMRIAAYIDLNPVRAGIVDKVEDYRWCYYARAVAGESEAREGLGMILDNSNEICGEKFKNNWSETSSLYRLWLYHEGQEVLPDYAKGERGRRGFSQKQLQAVEQKCGRMAKAEVLRCRIRYFTDGAAIGTADFIEKVFNSNRSNFGSKRSSGSRSMCGADWGNLKVIRDLREVVISFPGKG